jgi:hypothetical protein
MADFRTRTEMGTQKDFVQALESLVSGNANTDSSFAGTYVTGINRPLGRLSRNADALLDAIQVAKNCVLDPAAGDVTLEYTTDNKLKMEGTTGIHIRMANNVEAGQVNLIAPGAALISGLSAGNVLYVQLNRASNATITIASKADWATYVNDSKGQANRLSWLVFGVVTAAETLVLFNGTTIRKGQRLENGLATDTQYASRFNVQQNASIFLAGGGNLSFDTTAANEFTLSAPLLVALPGGGAGKGGITVPAGSYSVDDGYALYVTDLNRSDTVGSVSPSSAALDALPISNTVRDLFVIAYRSGTVLYLANGVSIQDGETYRLTSSPVYALKVPDETSGALVDMDGTLTLKKAAGTVVEGSASTSHIRIRNRRDNLQISIGTTLSWDSTTGVLAFGVSGAVNGIRVYHPDYTTGSAELANFINPGSTLTIPDGECVYVPLVAVTSSDQAHTTVTSGAGTSPGIYVDEIEDVNESDSDLFIFAYRTGTRLYLWDGTFLEGSGGGSPETTPGASPDPALISAQYRYSHEDITFTFDRGAPAKVTVAWGSAISLFWPSGGYSTINAASLNMDAGSPTVRVSIPMSARGPTSSSAFSATVGARSAVTDIEDLILFDLTAVPATRAAEPKNPVKVFGGRFVVQNYELSGGAASAVTGHVSLGNVSTLSMLGQKTNAEAQWYSSYPSKTNPFITSETGHTVKLGTYTGRGHGGSPALSFTPKMALYTTGGSAQSGGSQATDFSFGDVSGVTTKKREVFLSALEIYTLTTAANTLKQVYTSDEGAGTSARPALAQLGHNPSGGLLTLTSSLIGPAIDALVMTTGLKVRLPYIIPTGCTLSKIRLFWAETNGASNSRLRVSLSEHISETSAFTGTYAETSRSTLLTNGSGTTSVGSESFVNTTSASITGIVKRGVFDFANAAVSSVSLNDRTVSHPLQRLYIGFTQDHGSYHLIGISIEYTSNSVAALLGIENA